jgi:hypothetical protein
MINKGKGCISAIFNGSIPIGVIKHGLDTIFQKPSEPVEPTTSYINNGLVALFSGEDDYKDGAWVDRVSGYKFTPLSTSTAPVYDSEYKLYDQNTFGGMVSDFTIPAGGNFSFEVVTRDIYDATSSNMNSNYATIVGCAMDGWSIASGGIVFIRRQTSENGYSFGSSGASVETYKLSRNNVVDNGLDTFTYVPNVGMFRNGVKVSDAGESKAERKVGLFTHYSGSYTNTYKAKAKIHSVRVYNRELTAEEVAHNYEVDKEIYTIKVDTDNYVSNGLLFYLSGEDAPVDNTWIDRISKTVTTLYNSPTYDSNNKCYSFNGTNQYGTFNMSSATSGDFTLEVYYKQDTVGPFDVMCGTKRGSANGYGILNNNGANYAWIYGGSSLTLASADRPTQVAGRKVYTRLSREGSTMHFDLIDSQQNVNKTFAGTSINLGVSSFRIANSGSSNIYSKAQIYSIRLYNRILTDEEIAQNHAEDVRIYGE